MGGTQDTRVGHRTRGWGTGHAGRVQDPGAGQEQTAQDMRARHRTRGRGERRQHRARGRGTGPGGGARADSTGHAGGVRGDGSVEGSGGTGLPSTPRSKPWTLTLTCCSASHQPGTHACRISFSTDSDSPIPSGAPGSSPPRSPGTASWFTALGLPPLLPHALGKSLSKDSPGWVLCWGLALCHLPPPDAGPGQQRPTHWSWCAQSGGRWGRPLGRRGSCKGLRGVRSSTRGLCTLLVAKEELGRPTAPHPTPHLWWADPTWPRAAHAPPHLHLRSLDREFSAASPGDTGRPQRFPEEASSAEAPPTGETAPPKQTPLLPLRLLLHLLPASRSQAGG